MISSVENLRIRGEIIFSYRNIPHQNSASDTTQDQIDEVETFQYYQ